LRRDYFRAEQFALETCKLAEELNQKSLIFGSLSNSGWVKWAQGDLSGFAGRMEEALCIAKQAYIPWFIAESLYYLGESYRLKGVFAQAKNHYTQALVVYRKENIKSGYWHSLEGLGLLAID